MDDTELQDALMEIDAYDSYNTKSAEVEANAAADEAPVPTEVVLDADPVPTEVNLEEAAGTDAKSKLKAHKNALDEQVRQDVQRMAKEMGVDYEDLFAASGGPTPDEVETSAEKKREAKDPQAEQKEAKAARPSAPPAPVKRQEDVKPAAPRTQEDRQQELKAQAKQNETPKPAAKAEAKADAPKAAAPAAPKPKAAEPHKAEAAHKQPQELHRSPEAQSLRNHAEAAAMKARGNPESREQFGKEAVRGYEMGEMDKARNDPNRGKPVYHVEDYGKIPLRAPAPTNREVSPVIEQMHRNGQINDRDYQNMVNAIKGQ